MFHIVPSADHALQQDPAFAAALAHCGQPPVILPTGQIMLHRRIAGVPFAMLPRATPPDDLAAQLRAIGLARTPLILSPEHPGQTPGVRLRKPAMTAVIDLTPDDQMRLAALHPKWRNQLRRAKGANLRVRSAPLQPADTLPQRDAAQANARGYRNWPVALTRAFAQAAPSQTRLFTATHAGHPIAQMLFLLHGTRATYHIGQTTAEGRATHAHNVILWEAQRWLKRIGITQLDLGLIHSSTPDLNRFKTRAGGIVRPMGGTYLRWTPLALRG